MWKAGKRSLSSSSMNRTTPTTTTIDDETALTYHCLYWKRKHHSKVHVNKGSSKLDGLLKFSIRHGTVQLQSKPDDEETKDSDDESRDNDSESDDEFVSKAKNRKAKWKRSQKKVKHNHKKPQSLYTGRLTEFVVASGGRTVTTSGINNTPLSKEWLQSWLSDYSELIVGGIYHVEIVSLVGQSSTKTNTPRLGHQLLSNQNRTLSSSNPLLPKQSKNTATHRVVTNIKRPMAIENTVNRTVLNSKRPAAQPLLKRPRTANSVVKPAPTVVGARVPLLTRSTHTVASRSLSSTSNPRRSMVPSQGSNGTTNFTAATDPSATDWSKTLSHIPLPATVGRALRRHQVEGVAFLWKALGCSTMEITGTELTGAILADEMGLGKTLMTIAVIAALHRQYRKKKFMIICPSSLVSNWAKEFDKWIGCSQPQRVTIQNGQQDDRMRVFANSHQGQVAILSYDIARLHLETLRTSLPLALLVVDEGHRLKSTSGSRTLTALAAIPTQSRLCLTATPIQNNLGEFYALANFSRPGVFGDLANFRKLYERPMSRAASGNRTTQRERNSGATQSRAFDEITKTFMLRRLQSEVLRSMLPPRTEVLLFCQPTERQCELYRTITNNSTIDRQNAGGCSLDALTSLTAVRKVCSHPCLYEDSQYGRTEDLALSGKLVVLDALLRSIKEYTSDKVVLVSNFTSVLSLIERILLIPRQYSYTRLDGTTNAKTRQSVVDSFNRDVNKFCFLLSSKAGGCGLNLVGANRLVLLDPDWNPANDIQSMGRVYRQGQTKPTFIYRLLTSGTVEEVIFQRQVKKGNLATMAMDKKKAFSSQITSEELIDCFTLKTDCACDSKRKLGWKSDYDSSEPTGSLATQGCLDDPLAQAAKATSETLSYIQVVKEDINGELIPSDGEADDQPGYNSSDEEECEFSADDVTPTSGSHSNGKEASFYDTDEEEEFEL